MAPAGSVALRGLSKIEGTGGEGWLLNVDDALEHLPIDSLAARNPEAEREAEGPAAIRRYLSRRGFEDLWRNPRVEAHERAQSAAGSAPVVELSGRAHEITPPCLWPTMVEHETNQPPSHGSRSGGASSGSK